MSTKESTGISKRVIDVFEGRVNKLLSITGITKLPQWTDADVIGARELIMQYRKEKSK